MTGGTVAVMWLHLHGSSTNRTVPYASVLTTFCPNYANFCDNGIFVLGKVPLTNDSWLITISVWFRGISKMRKTIVTQSFYFKIVDSVWWKLVLNIRADSLYDLFLNLSFFIWKSTCYTTGIEYLLLLFTELHLGQIKPAQTYKYKINC